VAYDHTQRGVWHFVFLGLTALLLLGACFAHVFADRALHREPIVAIALASAAVLFLCALVFGSLTVRDDGEWLALRFGPVPLLRKRIRYADITAVEPSRSSVIDGWGIHYIIGRGWTYNLWGFGCVKLMVRGKTIRVGSDDVANLARFLQERIGLDTSKGP
jgi:hypothetical protein